MKFKKKRKQKRKRSDECQLIFENTKYFEIIRQIISVIKLTKTLLDNLTDYLTYYFSDLNDEQSVSERISRRIVIPDQCFHASLGNSTLSAQTAIYNF